jgi:diguanylate cyclase (GGDEF)-like protein
MPSLPPADRLLAIIQTQNQIVAGRLDLYAAVTVVTERAFALTGAEVMVDEHGTLRLRGPAPARFGEAEEATLELLSAIIGAHMAAASDVRGPDGDSRHDRLTGLRNRRAFDERLESELARARRHGGQFALCLLDLNALREINGRDGRAGGDAVLRAVAGHLSQVRGEDAAYRLGSDEFALVLVEASSFGAEAAIDRVTAAIAEDASCRSVGCSWGVATFQRGDDAASMLARADAALYRTKATVGTRS